MTQEIITITVEAGQMTARRKPRKIALRRPVPVWAIVKYAALTTIFYFHKMIGNPNFIRKTPISRCISVFKNNTIFSVARLYSGQKPTRLEIATRIFHSLRLPV